MSGSSYDINGVAPFSPFVLNAGSSQNLQLVVVPASENSLMVSVKTSAGLPISGASVTLTGPNGYNQTFVSGQGYFDQTDWSHGATQPNIFSDPSAYASGSGVDTSTSTGTILLSWSIGPNPYGTNATGTLQSSIFDTGTTSNFYALNWSPSSQPVLTGQTPIHFQFATAPSSTGPWNFVGPDGTPTSYYSTPGTQISFPNGGNEFARYMLFMTTQTATVTPSINDISFTYTSGCVPPGQVLFQGLAGGSSYVLNISKSGYTTYTSSPFTVVSGWQNQTVQLTNG